MDPDLTNDPGDVDDDDDDIISLDPDELLERFIILDATENTGTLQIPGNLTDRISYNHWMDSLWLIKDIEVRVGIKFLKEAFSGSSHFYFQVDGGEKYLDILADERESNDSTGVFYMGFDPENLELPISFKVKIALHDDSGNQIEMIESVVTVLDPENKDCDLEHPHNYWRWVYTVMDGMVEMAPGFGRGVATHVTGCCNDTGESVDCIESFIEEDDWIRLEGYSAYIINHEILEFTSSSVSGELEEYVQNLNPSPEETNFCTGNLLYNIDVRENLFWGDYTFDASSGLLEFQNLESRVTLVDFFGQEYPWYDQMFISESAKYEVIGCHYLMETSSREGASVIRLFERVGEHEDE